MRANDYPALKGILYTCVINSSNLVKQNYESLEKSGVEENMTIEMFRSLDCI